MKIKLSRRDLSLIRAALDLYRTRAPLSVEEKETTRALYAYLCETERINLEGKQNRRDLKVIWKRNQNNE